MRDGSPPVLERRAQPEISELERGQSCGKPGGSDLRAQALRYCCPQETVSSSPPVPHPPGWLERLKGGKRSFAEGVELPPAILSWPWARRLLLAEPVGGRGALWKQGWRVGPSQGLHFCLISRPGVTGGRKGRTWFLKCLLCAYAEHSTLKVAFHFIPRLTLRDNG